MKHISGSVLSSLLIVSPAYALEAVSEQRLDEVVQRGVQVMPFDLEQTLHVFSKSVTGGIQQVIVKGLDGTEQIKLIREHLKQISLEFQQGNFTRPGEIHGDTMPGLNELRQAESSQINIMYKDLSNGAQIEYSTDSPVLVHAVHKWFDAQLTDHARHAVSGHSMHYMHHK